MSGQRAPASAPMRTLQPRSTWSRPQLGLVALLVGLGAWLRLWNLPHWWSIYNDYDEGAWAMAGKLIAEGQVPYRDFLLVHPPLYEYVLAGVFSVAGFSFLAGRHVAVFFALVAIPLAAYVAGRAFGPRAGVWSAFFFAVSPIMVFAGRRVVPDAFAIALALGAVGLAFEYLRRPRLAPLGGFGGLLGLLVLTKFTHMMTGAALTIGLVAATMPDSWWERGRRAFSPRIIGGALLIAAPIYSALFLARFAFDAPVKIPLLDDFRLVPGDLALLALVALVPYVLAWFLVGPREPAPALERARVPWREAGVIGAFAAGAGLLALGPALVLAPADFIHQTWTLQSNRPGVIAPSLLQLVRYFMGFFAPESLYQAELLLIFPLVWLATRGGVVSPPTRFLVAGGLAALLFVQPLGSFPRYYISIYPFMLLLAGVIFGGLRWRAHAVGLRQLGAVAIVLVFLSLSIAIPQTYWGYDIANRITDPSEEELNQETLTFLHSIGAQRVYATSPTLLTLDPALQSATTFDTFAYLWLLNETAAATADRVLADGVDTIVITPWSHLWGGEFGEKSQAFNQALRARASLVRIIGTDPVYHMEVYHVRGEGGNAVFNPTLDLLEHQQQGVAPVGWSPVQYANKDSAVNVSRLQEDGRDFTRFAVRQSGSAEQGDWAHAGVVQTMPLQDLVLEARVRTTAMTTEGRETEIESGIQFRDEKGHWLIVGFGGGSGPSRYERPEDNWTMTIFPVRSGVWEDLRVDVAALWADQGWPVPKQVTAEVYAAAHRARPGEYHFDVEYVGGVGA